MAGGDGGVGEDVAPGADVTVDGQDDRAAQEVLGDDLDSALASSAGIGPLRTHTLRVRERCSPGFQPS